MEKILLNENKEMADSHLSNMNEVARNLTNIIHEYNNLPVLKKLETGEQVFNFLSNPLDYFDSRIIIDTNMSISESVRLNPGQLAKLCNIPYSSFINRIGSSRFTYLEYFTWDEKEQVIEINPDKIESIRESFKEYTEDPKEIKAIIEIRKMCELLNKHCKRYDRQDDLDRTAHTLGLKIVVNPKTGMDYVFIEDIQFIREMILIEKF